MSVFRIERNKNYTVMSNYHLRDTTISLKSKGLLSMMLSLPDEWNYTTRGLAKICKEGVDALAAVKCSGQWMFVDAAGELTDLGVFQQAKSFSAGLAPAKKDGKWGYINSQGEWVIEPQFEDANAFDASGAAFVKTDEGKWRLLTLDRFFH